MAKQFPKCQFVGIDVFDVFPKNDVPSNCKFKLANALES
jgi:hypothetical protein